MQIIQNQELTKNPTDSIFKPFRKIKTSSLFRVTPLPNCWVYSHSAISLEIYRKRYFLKKDHMVTQVRMHVSKLPNSTFYLKQGLLWPDQAVQGFVQSSLGTLQGWKDYCTTSPLGSLFGGPSHYLKLSPYTQCELLILPQAICLMLLFHAPVNHHACDTCGSCHMSLPCSRGYQVPPKETSVPGGLNLVALASPHIASTRHESCPWQGSWNWF